MKTALRVLGILATAGVICLPSPVYARAITGGHKMLDAAIVSLFYMVGVLIIGHLMPKDIKENGNNGNLH